VKNRSQAVIAWRTLDVGYDRFLERGDIEEYCVQRPCENSRDFLFAILPVRKAYNLALFAI